MSQYILNLSAPKDMCELWKHTGFHVIVAKPAQGEPANVAWQVFEAMETNSISWEEQYGIYASTAEVVNGAELRQMSRTEFPAHENRLYTFESAGVFSEPEKGGVPGSFSVSNQYEARDYLTMGLFQAANVNGITVPGNAISAAPVPALYQTQITPFTTVYVWVQGMVVSNSVVTTTTSIQTKAVFGGAVTEISLAYDKEKASFQQVPGVALAAGASIETLVPAL